MANNSESEIFISVRDDLTGAWVDIKVVVTLVRDGLIAQGTTPIERARIRRRAFLHVRHTILDLDKQDLNVRVKPPSKPTDR